MHSPILRLSLVGMACIALPLSAVRGQDKKVKPAQPAEPAAETVDSANAELAVAGKTILEKYCYRCHGVEFKKPGLDVLDRATLIQPKDKNEAPYLVPGDPAKSRIWEAVETNYMPPEKQPQLTDGEKATLQQWIQAGGEFPPADRPQREFLGEDTILGIIFDDLNALPSKDRAFARYFSLAHLWNDSDVSDEQLRIYRAAVSKLINSLSREFRITVPRPVNPDGTILAIDLRDYGWTHQKQWHPLLAAYPYGLQRGGEQAERVYELTDCELPYLRADWFVHTAARPPLYHDLLLLPDSAVTLEDSMDIDILGNFQKDRLARAGFSKSGVSAQNRLVERHEARNGAYWKSYDFKSNLNRGNLFRFPLGPEFSELSNQTAAFEHDGGEIIFNLPNGLQAYLLVDGDDHRINDGPQTVVNDPNQFSGTFTIVNGISCMGCHKQGMITFEDTVRPTFANVAGQPTADKVRRLYPPVDEMNALVRDDMDRFLAAAEKATGPLLRKDAADKRKLDAFPEPVTRASKDYERPLTVEDVARELGLPLTEEQSRSAGVPRADELATVIKVSDEMRRLGLARLSTGETVPREVWEQAFQEAAHELKLGIPLEIE
jgi:mono/diheme cytochrome c family protein